MKNKTTNELYGAGDVMKRPKLARTLRKIAEQGPEVFYTGTLADQIVKEIQDRGGIITKQDLADYQVDFREALTVHLNESLTAFTTQAPSSGPILTFILNILRGILVSIVRPSICSLLVSRLYRSSDRFEQYGHCSSLLPPTDRSI